MAPLYEGNIDLGYILGILRKAGYDRDANIEDESLGGFAGEERKCMLKRDIAYVRRIIEEL